MTIIEHDATTTDEFVEKLFTAVLGAQEVQAAYLGDRLGWYDALAEEPLTSTQLAERTGTSERYAREWLEHQAVAGRMACGRGVGVPACSSTRSRMAPHSGHHPAGPEGARSG